MAIALTLVYTLAGGIACTYTNPCPHTIIVTLALALTLTLTLALRLTCASSSSSI